VASFVLPTLFGVVCPSPARTGFSSTSEAGPSRAVSRGQAMTRAREWWQEKRYAADTSTTQPSGVGRRSRLLIASVALLSALSIVPYASRRSNPVPNPVLEPPLKAALVTPDPVKRRSFTSRVTADAAPPLAATTLPDAFTAREQVPLADPITTGSVPGAESGQTRAISAKPRITPKVRLSSEQSIRDPQPPGKTSGARVRRNRLHSQVASSKPERIVAAAPAATSVCLAFIVCF
jgi:hypothetical protein